MTDTATTSAELEARITELERRLGVDPAALVPPITIGELTDVPVPGSQLAAAWAQEVSSRVVQRFANVGALQAWAAPEGAFAVDLATGVLWRRGGGGWTQFSPWTGTGVGTAAGGWVGLNGQRVVATLTIPADLGQRTAYVSSFLQIETGGSFQYSVELIVNGGLAAIADLPITGTNGKSNVALSANYNIGGGVPIPVQLRVTPNSGSAAYNVFAGPQQNRIDAIVVPRGNS